MNFVFEVMTIKSLFLCWYRRREKNCIRPVNSQPALSATIKVTSRFTVSSLLWILKATPKVTMKLLCLALLVASTSAFDLSKLRLAAPPTEIEYGFCGEFNFRCPQTPFLPQTEALSLPPLTTSAWSPSPSWSRTAPASPLLSRSPSTSPCLRAPPCPSTWCWRASSPSRSPASTLMV